MPDMRTKIGYSSKKGQQLLWQRFKIDDKKATKHDVIAIWNNVRDLMKEEISIPSNIKYNELSVALVPKPKFRGRGHYRYPKIKLPISTSKRLIVHECLHCYRLRHTKQMGRYETKICKHFGIKPAWWASWKASGLTWEEFTKKYSLRYKYGIGEDS